MVSYTIANIVLLNGREMINMTFTSTAETMQEQTSGGFSMGWLCLTEKSLTFFTLNGHSSPAFLCISDLSVDRLFSLLLHPFFIELLSASLPCLLALWLQKNTVYFQAEYFHPQAVLAPQGSLLLLLTALETAESQKKKGNRYH